MKTPASKAIPRATDKMSQKSEFLPRLTGEKILKRLETSRKVKALFYRKEGRPDYIFEHPEFTALQIAALEGDSRRCRILIEVFEKLYNGLQCDSVLSCAVFKWIQDRCRSDGSIVTYLRRFAKWVSFFDKRNLSTQIKTSSRELLDFVYELEKSKLGKRTVASHLSIVRSWLGWLVDRDIISKSPVNRDVKRAVKIDHESIQKADGSRQAFTFEQAQKIVQWAVKTPKPEKGLSVLLQMVAGLRSCEVVKLEKRNVVKIDGIYSINVPGKGSKFRKVILENPVVVALERYLKIKRRQGDRGPLLVSPGGGKFSRRSIQRWAKEAAALVGRAKEISSHDLRKTAGTLRIKKGKATPDQTRRFLGHSDVKTTLQCYVVGNDNESATTHLTVENEEDKCST